MTAGRARRTARGAAGPGLKRAGAIAGEVAADAPTKGAAKAGEKDPAKVDGAGATPAVEYAADAYCVSVPQFEGPLDLLLQLIQKHELDILDIPVGFVTEKYLEYLGIMRSLSIDVASEYLVMAATLTHIKSKMLLPELPKESGDDVEEEEEDPRADLIRRLLEYQKYKAAAESLGGRETLGKDVFPRGAHEPVPTGPAPFAASTTFELLDAFSKILSRTKTKVEHEVVFDRISISDRISELVDSLKERRSTPFEELFARRAGGEAPTRFDLIITFLAVLEMARLRMMRVYQADSLSQIHCELLVVDEDAALDAERPDDLADREARTAGEAIGEPGGEAGAVPGSSDEGDDPASAELEFDARDEPDAAFDSDQPEETIPDDDPA